MVRQIESWERRVCSASAAQAVEIDLGGRGTAPLQAPRSWRRFCPGLQSHWRRACDVGTTPTMWRCGFGKPDRGNHTLGCSKRQQLRLDQRVKHWTLTSKLATKPTCAGRFSQSANPVSGGGVLRTDSGRRPVEEGCPLKSRRGTLPLGKRLDEKAAEGLARTSRQASNSRSNKTMIDQPRRPNVPGFSCAWAKAKRGAASAANRCWAARLGLRLVAGPTASDRPAPGSTSPVRDSFSCTPTACPERSASGIRNRSRPTQPVRDNLPIARTPRSSPSARPARTARHRKQSSATTGRRARHHPAAVVKSSGPRRPPAMSSKPRLDPQDTTPLPLSSSATTSMLANLPVTTDRTVPVRADFPAREAGQLGSRDHVTVATTTEEHVQQPGCPSLPDPRPPWKRADRDQLQNLAPCLPNVQGFSCAEHDRGRRLLQTL